MFLKIYKCFEYCISKDVYSISTEASVSELLGGKTISRWGDEWCWQTPEEEEGEDIITHLADQIVYPNSINYIYSRWFKTVEKNQKEAMKPCSQRIHFSSSPEVCVWECWELREENEFVLKVWESEGEESEYALCLEKVRKGDTHKIKYVITSCWTSARWQAHWNQKVNVNFFKKCGLLFSRVKFPLQLTAAIRRR